MIEFNVTDEYSRIMDLEKIQAKFSYETWLGADIYFTKLNTGVWDIQIYSRLRGTPLERLMVISALASIKRMTKEWYTDDTLPFNITGPQLLKEFNLKNTKSEEIAEEVMCDVRNSLHYAFEVDYLLKNHFLTVDDVRELSKYYQSISMVTSMLFQFLAAVAAVRKHGGSVSLFNDDLISMKRYELLKIIDIEEEIISTKRITVSNIRDIFNLLYPDLETNLKVLKMITKRSLEGNQNENEYHVALSFAGEDRKIAKHFADALTIAGYKVFYDEYEQAVLWGKDLYSHLSEVYSKRAKYCLMIISKSYAEKLWTNHERKAAQAKAFEQSAEYILPLRLDDTEIPGVHSTIGYIDYNAVGFDTTLGLLKQKLAD